MNSEDKKKIISQYKQRLEVGGVIAVKNNATGKVLLVATCDVDGYKNRFEFSKKMGSAVTLKLAQDWKLYGSNAFSLEVLETIKKGENQTPKEFDEDVKLLKELWQEKFSADILY
ncbi:MAG: GIY-YIG nuclease family protein [Eubacteriaceae bacterium]|nr:GIY-YIG nuclease family protein [Eubacteriaceae bacterium]